MSESFYPLVIQEEDGVFFAYVIDLKGCMADGDSPAEAVTNVALAIKEWCDEARRLGRKIPKPGQSAVEAARGRKMVANILNEQAKIIKEQNEILHRQDSLLNETLEGLNVRLAALEEQIRASELQECDVLSWQPSAVAVIKNRTHGSSSNDGTKH